MAFIPGPVPMMPVNPAFSADRTSNFIQDQVYSGLGQNFVASQGQTFQGGLSDSVVNIGLNQDLGEAVNSASGLNLFNGLGPVASSVTPLIPADLSSNINGAIGNSFASAGGFASLLGNNPLVGSALGAVSGLLSGIGGGLWGKLEFPGGGEHESRANFSGGHYSLGFGGGDVTFTITRANRGPQEYGSAIASNTPTMENTLGTNQYTTNVPNFSSKAFAPASQAKITNMFSKNTAPIYQLPSNLMPKGNIGFQNINIPNQYSY